MTGAVWEAGVVSPEGIVPEPEADRGGRSRGRRPPRGPLVVGRGSGEVQGWCWVEGELAVAIYSRPEAVAKNGITPASDYSEAVIGQVV